MTRQIHPWRHAPLAKHGIELLSHLITIVIASTLAPSSAWRPSLGIRNVVADVLVK